MIITPYRHTPYSIGRGSAAFSIAKSFYLDGVDEYFTIPQASLDPIISGTDKKFTMSFGFKRVGLGTFQGLFGWGTSSSFWRFDTNDKLVISLYDTVFKAATFSNTFNNITDWYFVTVVYDSSLTLGNRVEMYINGVKATKLTDTTTNIVDASNSDYQLGRAGVVYEFSGYIQHFSVCDIALSEAQSIQLYNNGKPKNTESLFGANCKFFFNPDNRTGDTAQFSLTNQGITATSVNLEDADLTSITPY